MVARQVLEHKGYTYMPGKIALGLRTQEEHVLASTSFAAIKTYAIATNRRPCLGNQIKLSSQGQTNGETSGF